MVGWVEDFDIKQNIYAISQISNNMNDFIALNIPYDPVTTDDMDQVLGERKGQKKTTSFSSQNVASIHGLHGSWIEKLNYQP